MAGEIIEIMAVPGSHRQFQTVTGKLMAVTEVFWQRRGEITGEIINKVIEA